MKMSFCKIIAAIILLASLAAAFAQPKPEGNPPKPNAPNPGRFQDRLAGTVRRGDPFVERFVNVLTDEQKESFRKASEGQRDKSRELEEKLRDARKAILEATLAEKLDEDALRKKFMDAAKIDADLTVLRAKALSQVKPPLSKEQIEKLKAPQTMEGGNFRGRFGNEERAKPIEPGRDKNDLPPPPKPQ